MPEMNPRPRPQPGRGAAAAEQRRQAARQRAARRRAAGFGAAVLLVVAVVVIAAATSSEDGSGDDVAAPAGTKTFDDLSRQHVPGAVNYPQTQPVGGDHAGTWQNCGFYDEKIVTEQGVHSMEHGAVWLTYRPDLPTGQIASLERLAEGQTYILASPWPEGLPDPVVASAWGRQLGLASADDPKLTDFIRAFRSGPQTPEPGAPCTGGQRGMG